MFLRGLKLSITNEVMKFAQVILFFLVHVIFQSCLYLMGTCNKLQISLSIGAIFCSRLFLDFWICVDRLCKCIVDWLYTVDMSFFGFMTILYVYFNENNEAPKLVMNLWHSDRLWFMNLRYLYFWIYEYVIGCDFFLGSKAGYVSILMRIIEALK